MNPSEPNGAAPRVRFNLSEWALTHRPLVLYLILAFALMGALAYGQLGQSEDPPFTFKVVVVKTTWPGASARDVEQQVTDRIERKLQELPLEWVRSYSKPGESLVFVSFRDSTPSAAVPELQYQVRKKIGDIRNLLPAGVQGPYFNDEFGDTYTDIYAVTGEGFGYRELKEFGDRIRAELLRVPGVAKVDFIGEQDEKIYIELSNARLALLGIEPAEIVRTLAAQNAVAAAGVFETATDRIYVRPTGAFGALDAVRDLAIRANGRLFRLGDIAEVKRGYVDPPLQKMRWQGRDALGIGVTMVKGGDVIELGRALDARLAAVEAELPVGVEVGQVASMPHSVARSIREFVRSLAEAVAIVLVVSLVSLGLRTGLVVAVSIPLVLATTFLRHVAARHRPAQDLARRADPVAGPAGRRRDHRRRDDGDQAGAGLRPVPGGELRLRQHRVPDAVGDAGHGRGLPADRHRQELDRRVHARAVRGVGDRADRLVVRRGDRDPVPRLPDAARFHQGAARVARRAALRAAARARRAPERAAAHADPERVYDTPFYRRFRALVDWNVAHRWFVIGATLAVFALALAAFRFVPQQFFPSSSRPELLVDLRLPEGSSFAATLAEAKRMEAILDREPGVESYVAYVGTGSPRFYLPLDQQLQNSNFAQFVLVAKSNAERERLRARIIGLFDEDFPGLRGRVSRLENGPPVGFPVQFRVSGEDLARVRAIAQQVMTVVRADPEVTNAQYDSDEPTKVIRLVIDQNKARVLGYSSQDLAAFLNNSVSGLSITYLRERDKQIEVVLRGVPAERAQLSFLKDLALPTRTGKAVPITQVAEIRYEQEDGIVWRRDRLPAVTVRGDVLGDAQGPDVANRINPRLDAIRASLPLGYRIDLGGAIEDSARGQKSIAAGVPLMLLTVLTLLMLQLRSFSLTLMVMLTAPLGLIGVTAGLLAFRMPFGFVAMLGTIALSGIIMRNSIILVDQIEQDIAAGSARWDAIVGATTRRFRPIVLTAAAAVLAMIPLVRSDFFGPMAVAMMGGIVVATVLTLGFLPALYAAWFRVRRAPAGAQPAPV